MKLTARYVYVVAVATVVCVGLNVFGLATFTGLQAIGFIIAWVFGYAAMDFFVEFMKSQIRNPWL